MSVDATEMWREDKNSLLVAADSGKEDVATFSSSVGAGPVNEKTFVKKFNFRPEGESELFRDFIENVPSFHTVGENMTDNDSTKGCDNWYDIFGNNIYTASITTFLIGMFLSIFYNKVKWLLF